MAQESPKKSKTELLPILYVLPGASDGPVDADKKPTHGRPDVGNYTVLGEHFTNKGLIEKMVVVAYDIMAQSPAAAIPEDLKMPASREQPVWILVHSFGINFADALFEQLYNEDREIKIYVYGAYSARWMFDNGYVKMGPNAEGYDEYELYNYKMLCNQELPSMRFMAGSYVGAGETEPLLKYHDFSRKAAQAPSPVLIPKNRHGAFGAMSRFPESAAVLLAHIERRLCADGSVWFNQDAEDAREWKEAQEKKKEEEEAQKKMEVDAAAAAN